MGGYGNVVKLEEMRRKMEEKDFLSAINILDSMNTEKIKNISDLSLMSEVYSQNARYDEAKELLLRIYDKTKARKTLYQLVWVSIDRGNETDAERYLSEYEKITPKDFYNYIFRYKIDKLKGQPYEKLIDTLEKLKKVEYIEKWAYELAKLYYKTGMEKECVEECSDIILWFGEGTYVEKARMLKSYFSGDKDKDKMIEELKRRANNEFAKGSKSNKVELNEDSIQPKHKLNREEDNDIGEHIVETIDFTPKDDMDQFSTSLSQDVQDIMIKDKQN